ncbi:hypothetical protein FKM82_024221 [Ascaphus truei]
MCAAKDSRRSRTKPSITIPVSMVEWRKSVSCKGFWESNTATHKMVPLLHLRGEGVEPKQQRIVGRCYKKMASCIGSSSGQ